MACCSLALRALKDSRISSGLFAKYSFWTTLNFSYIPNENDCTNCLLGINNALSFDLALFVRDLATRESFILNLNVNSQAPELFSGFGAYEGLLLRALQFLPHSFYNSTRPG